MSRISKRTNLEPEGNYSVVVTQLKAFPGALIEVHQFKDIKGHIYRSTVRLRQRIK